jgi:MATE family multidrug resistance protein
METVSATAGDATTLAPARRPIVELLALALPTVAQMASYTVMQFADTYMLSLVGGVEATAAGQAGMLSFTFISFGMGVLFVINTLVSQSFGRRDFRACGQYLWQGVWFAIGFALLTLPLLPVAESLFKALGHEARLAQLEGTYFAISLTFASVKLTATAVGQFVLAINRPNVVLAAAFTAMLVNVFANWVLIYGHLGFPAMGVAGAAWGTNVGVACELAVLIAFIALTRIGATFNARDWRIRRALFATLLRIGAPSGVQIVAEVAAWTLFSAWVMGLFGTDVMTANNFMFRYMSVSFMPAFGFAAAVTALVGRYIGMGRPDLAIRRAHLGFAVTSLYMLCCAAAFVIFSEPLMRLFTSDPNVIRIGRTLLVFAAVYQLFDAMYVIYNGALRGAGDTFIPAVVTAALCWGITVIGGYLIARTWPQWGVSGPWGAATFYGVLLGLFLLARFALGHWKRIHLHPHAPVIPGSNGEGESIRLSGGAAPATAVHDPSAGKI